jgi:rhodanese-related sulfurtransferase
METGARLVCLGFLLVLAIGARAHDLPEDSGKHWRVISTEELQALRESETEFLLVNVLPKIIHDQMHIPGSINIPLGKVSSSQDLPEEKNALIVFYCMGRLCRYSPQAADLAHERGYSNLLVYRDGILAWRRAGLPMASLATYPKVDVPLISSRELLADREAWILDLRPADYFARGHIKGSTNIDLEVLHEKLHLLPRNRRIVLVDHKARLLLTTARFLASQGITKVLRLDGGFHGWVKSDLPVEQGTGSVVASPPRATAADQSLQ